MRIVVPLDRPGWARLGQSVVRQQRCLNVAGVALLRRSSITVVLALLGMPVAVLAQMPAPSQQSPQPAEALPPRQSQPLSGLVTIESDRQMADNATGIVTATGNVRITYPDQRVIATARQVQYFTRENIVVISGEIDVVQKDGHSIRAEQLHYDINRERLVLTPPPGEQVVTTYNLNAQQSPAMAPAPVR